jgi:hypothetical protein
VRAQDDGPGLDFVRSETSYEWTRIGWTSARRREDIEPGPFDRLLTIYLKNPWRKFVLNGGCGAAQGCEINSKGTTIVDDKTRYPIYICLRGYIYQVQQLFKVCAEGRIESQSY